MNNWVKKFLDNLTEYEVQVKIISTHKSWIETAIIGGHGFFTKSVTNQTNRVHYFVGINPQKMHAEKWKAKVMRMG